MTKKNNDSSFEANVQQMINDITNDIYSNVVNMVRVNQDNKSTQSDTKEKAALGVSAILPGVLTTLGLLLSAPAIATGGLAFLGGIGGAAMQIPFLKNKENDPLFSLQTDKSALESSKNSTENKIQELMNYINEYVAQNQSEINILENRILNIELAKNDPSKESQQQERKPIEASGYDITLDRKFGEWAQRFLAFANKSDDRTIARMGDELVTRLATMKIKVYDEPILNSEGKPDVPFFDYLIDESDGEHYTEVVKPAIFSDRSLLARGEIR